MTEQGEEPQARVRSDAASPRFRALADVVDGCVFEVDDAGRISAVGDEFVDWTGYDRADVLGEQGAAVFEGELPELPADQPDAAASAGDRTAVTLRTASGERVDGELRLRPIDSDRRDAGGDESTASEGAIGVVERSDSGPETREQRRQTLETLHDAATGDDRSTAERVEAVLDVVHDVLGTDCATLSRVDDDEYVFEAVRTPPDFDVEAGGVTDPQNLPVCSQVVETGETHSFRDVTTEAPDLTDPEWGIETYVGAPLVVDGDVYGTFCFYGTEPSEEPFTDWEVTLVDVAAKLVSDQLEREHARSELHERSETVEATRRRYETLVENFPNGAVGLVDENLRYTTVGGTPQTGDEQTADELVGQHVSEALSEDMAAVIEPKYRAALDGERSDFVYETDDSVVRIRTFPVRDDDGTIVAAMGMSQDVTDQKERERELTKYETLVETVNDGIYVTDEDYQYTTVNDAFAELTGYSRAELLGSHASLVVDEETIEAAREIRNSDGDSRRSLETTVQRADGTEVPVEVTFSSLETGDGVERVGVVRDVTERRERRRRIEESERRYRALVESFPNGAVGLFDENLEYTALGGELVDETDVDPEDRVGRSVSDIYPDELTETVEPHFQAALNGETRSFELEYYDRHLSAQTLPIRDPDGDVDAGMLVVQDVTERTENRRMLEESEQRYRALVENLPGGGVGVFDEDLEYTLVDGTMWDDHELDAADLEGKTIWEALPEDTAADVEPLFEAALDGETGSVESTLGGRTYRVWATPLRDADGSVTAGQSIALDVTEQMEREQKLERTLDLLEKTERVADVGGWEIDPETMEVFWSDHLFDILGVEADEEPPLDEALDVYHDADQPDVAEAVEDALETGDPFDVEVRFHRPDGELRWLRVQGTPEVEDGDVVSLRGAAQDVTERKEREQFLEDAKAQMEAAAEAGAVGTWEWHIQEDRFVADSALARLFGVDPADAREGVPLSELTSSIHEDDREGVEAAIEEAVETCGDYEEEYRVYDADDELRWVVARGHVECDEDGNPQTFPGAITDITEQKRVERELDRQRKQLETLFGVLPVGVVVAESDGELVEANDVAEDIWGEEAFDASSVEEYDQYDIWWEDTGEPVDPREVTMAKVLRGETVQDPDIFRIEDTDGNERIIMVHGMPVFDADGGVDRGVITMTDITDRREYQRKLEESNERLEQFAYAASHDLQEPLRMISSYLSLIESRYEDALDEDGEEFIEYAVDGADRMQEMIDALLQYSRVETEGEDFEPVDLESLFEDVRRDYELKIEETDAEVTVGSLPTVLGDEGQLRQVFGNLLGNAIEYSGDEPPDVDVSAYRDGDEWVVAVADDGIGIDPEHADRVFDVFQRLHSHDEHSGTGIGLALCERIVERHGGDIWVESEPGDGSTFYFSIPDESSADD